MPPGEWWPKKKGGLCPPSRKKGGSGVPSFLFWEELTTWGISLSLPLRREGAEGFGQDVENGKSYFPPYFAFPTHMQRDFFFSGKKKRERSMSQLSPPFLPPPWMMTETSQRKNRGKAGLISSSSICQRRRNRICLYTERKKEENIISHRNIFENVLFSARMSFFPLSPFPVYGMPLSSSECSFSVLLRREREGRNPHSPPSLHNLIATTPLQTPPVKLSSSPLPQTVYQRFTIA